MIDRGGRPLEALARACEWAGDWLTILAVRLREWRYRIGPCAVCGRSCDAPGVAYTGTVTYNPICLGCFEERERA